MPGLLVLAILRPPLKLILEENPLLPPFKFIGGGGCRRLTESRVRVAVGVFPIFTPDEKRFYSCCKWSTD